MKIWLSTILGILALAISSFRSVPAHAYIEQVAEENYGGSSNNRYAQATREVQYETCTVDPAWVRPNDLDQEARLNSIPSFRGIDFTTSPYWTNNIFLLRVYGASALREIVFLSGLWPIQAEISRCYESSFDLEGISSGEIPVVWLLEHRIVDLSWQNDSYVMRVEPAQSGAELIQFSRVEQLSSLPLRVETQSGQESVSLNATSYEIITTQLNQALATPIQQLPQVNSPTTIGESQVPGIIEGRIFFPSSYVPALRVCAQSTDNPFLLNCITTQEDQTEYQLSVTSGEYFVFTQELEEEMITESFGYRITQYYTTESTNSSMSPAVVRVIAGETISNINPENPSLCTPPIAMSNGRPVPAPRWSRPSYCVTPDRR
jgi:hypothetical protein